MGHLAFSVETFSTCRHGAHRLGDFSRLPVAIRAAKLSLEDERVTLAVVRDRAGIMVYAADNRREWPQTPDIPLRDSAQTDSFESGGPDMPTDDEPADIRAFRRHGLVLFVCYLAAAWIEVPA